LIFPVEFVFNPFRGVDYHPSFQAMAFLMEETGECGEPELNHSDEQAEKFYHVGLGGRWHARLRQ
jgi:hypothetical protein